MDAGKWGFLTGDGSQFGIPGWGNNELQWYQAANATVANGVLTIEAREESVGGKAYTSARLRTLGLGDFTYGRFEARARLPYGQGLWPAFWMMPSDSIYGGWAASGEIDIMEQTGGDTIHGTIHYGAEFPENVSSGGTTSVPAGTADEFHVYAIEWEEGEIRWYLDGQLYSTKTSWSTTLAPFPAPFDADFHMILNLAVGGNFPGNPNPSTPFPSEFVVDYVRVYQEGPPSDPVAAAKCESTKAKLAGRYAKCASNVYARAVRRAEAADPTKLTRCADKLESGFAKAELRAAGSCPSTSDATTVQGSLDACIGQSLADLGGLPGPGGVEAVCQSNKVKEAPGKYVDCRFRETFKAVKKGLAPDFTRCEERLAKKWVRLEGNTRRPCSTNGDLVAIRADLDACHAATASSLTGPSCGNGMLNAGEECDDGNTSSGDGCSSQCAIEYEYEQDFEGLNQASATALSADGWVVYTNVYNGISGAWMYGYGTDPAPNGGSRYSALASGEGGAAQGNQQIVVFSDYNNGDHGNGHVLESLVFRERTVVAADVGKTIEFTFDAKRGDLAGTSTALAFVKTLDPNAGFAQTSFDGESTTSLPASAWSTATLSVDVHAGLVGHILQYGFSSRASNFAPSGMFYDNVAVRAVPTP